MWFIELINALISLFKRENQVSLVVSNVPLTEQNLTAFPVSPVSAAVISIPPEMLTRNFEQRELEVSEVGARKGIPNIATGLVLENLKHLCAVLLEPIRAHYGTSIKVTSGYRCPVINKIVGGVSNSQHTVGEAVDFTVKGNSVAEVFDYIKNSNLPYDQLIDEYGQWVHVSYKSVGKNRRQAFLKR